MSSDFLTGFTRLLIARLLSAGLVEIREGSEGAIAGFVGAALARGGEYGSLVSGVTRALIACPEVEELYATDEELKELINDLAYPEVWRP
ncbi:MAG: hypothetical protein JXX28_18235 [Deltaproteobacteria bacterium]|nr:hypothetical protein [Deltaproteobacteria bacterium]